MKYKTFGEWEELGFHVIKGEKSYGRNRAGVAVFSEEQVEEAKDVYDDMDMYDFCD